MDVEPLLTSDDFMRERVARLERARQHRLNKTLPAPDDPDWYGQGSWVRPDTGFPRDLLADLFDKAKALDDQALIETIHDVAFEETDARRDISRLRHLLDRKDSPYLAFFAPPPHVTVADFTAALLAACRSVGGRHWRKEFGEEIKTALLRDTPPHIPQWLTQPPHNSPFGMGAVTFAWRKVGGRGRPLSTILQLMPKA